MKNLSKEEKNVVRGALHGFKGSITRQYLKSVAKLPRNGKSAANASSEAAERSVIDQLKSVDTILGQLDNKSTEVTRTSYADHRFDQYNINSSQKDHGGIDDEPYENPFTGEMVYPWTPYAPGPSGVNQSTRSGIYILCDVDKAAFEFDVQDDDNDNDAEYRKALQAAAALSLSASSGDAIASFSHEVAGSRTLEIMPTTSSMVTPSTPSLVTPSASDLSVGIRGDELQNIFSEFDKIFANSNDHATKESGMSQNQGLTQDDSASPANHVQVISVLDSNNPFNQNNYTTYYSADNHLENMINTPEQVPVPDSHLQNYDDMQHGEGDQRIALEIYQRDLASNSQLEADLQLARELAQDTPQDIGQFLEASSKSQYQVPQELFAVQSEIYKQEQDELAVLEHMQGQWSRQWDDSIRGQQELAKRIAEQEEQMEKVSAMKEMRRLQEMYQVQELKQIEADRAFAWSLSEEASQGQPMPAATFLDAVSTQADSTPESTERRPKTSLHVQDEPRTSPNQSKKSLFSFHETDGGDGSDKFFRKAQLQHKQWQIDWQAEIQRAEEATKAARMEIENLEAQARRDYASVRDQHDRRRQEVEAQRMGEEKRRRREADERRIRDELARQEAQRARVAEEAAKKARMNDCAVCSDSFDKADMYQFPCKHTYCRGCLEKSIQNALKSKSIFKCCKHPIDTTTASRFLSVSFIQQYSNLVEELSTKKPLYCSTRKCSTFIAPTNIKGGIGKCPKCERQTCAKCKGASHVGICKEDKEGQAVLKLGKSKNWKQCPHCSNMVERSAGCLQMNCRCGKSFCYSCGKPSSECAGTCPRKW